jgi:hypothetical protein
VHRDGPHFGPRSSVWPGPAAQANAVGLVSLADKVRWERRHEHWGKLGRAPDKDAATGTHPSGVVAVRCEGDGSMAASEVVEALRLSSVVARGPAAPVNHERD